MVDLSIKDANATASGGGCGCGGCGCGGHAQPEAAPVAKTSNCGPDCTCGCQEGKPCTCGESDAAPAGATTARSKVALKSGSSHDGTKRRASEFSNWVYSARLLPLAVG